MKRKISLTLLCLAVLMAALSGMRGYAAPKREDLGPDLFLAVGRKDAAAVKALLAKNADPNARNFLSFTPLMFAGIVGDVESARLLLANGAELEAESPFGTALTFAVEADQPKFVRFLLARGANVNAKRGDKITTLMLAARIGYTDILQQLLDKKMGVNARDVDGATALMYAVRAGKTEAARLLIQRGASVDLADSRKWTALMYAAANGYPDLVRLLVQKGANVNAQEQEGRTPLLLAVRYNGQAATIQPLLEAGADVNIKDSRGQTALVLAATRGYEECVQALRAKGAAFEKGEPPLPMLTARAAIGKSLPLLQSATKTFAKNAGCTSCHHQGVGLMVTAIAKQHGFAIDTALAQSELKKVYTEQERAYPILRKALQDPNVAKTLPGVEISELTPGLSFFLSGLVAHNWPADEKLAASALVLAKQQAADGHWGFIIQRVPVQSSYFTVTALSLSILNAYAPKDHTAEIAERKARAKTWLLTTPARNTEDRTFRLLGLKWAGASLAERQKAIEELRALQRPDGGWAQLPSLHSDAYATGEALFALNQAGEVSVTDPAYQRGVRFLLNTQDEDGSLFVNKRAIPANNYFDAGFPHGESQFISYSATCWATMALALTAEPAQETARK